MRNLLALALIAWIVCFARSGVRDFLRRDEANWLIVPLAAAGLGIGLVTLALFWLLLLDARHRAFPVALAVTAAVFAAGQLLGVRAVRQTTEGAPSVKIPRDPLGLALFAALALCSAGIIFNAAYWPFDVGDALAIYAPFGKAIFADARLPIGDGLYESYPMLVPIIYASTHWAAGSVNESLARLAAALMAIGTIAVAGALGCQLRSRRTGLVAASLVALTPIFGRWASSGYTDVPAAFFVGLSALFVCRWASEGATEDLALASMFAGLALWTKNSVVTIIASLILVVLARHLSGHGARRRSFWRNIAIAFLPLVVIAGPWYARNWWLFGSVVPNPPWLDRAQRTIASFAVMLRPDRHFGVSGWLFTAALLYGLLLVLMNRAAFMNRWMVLAAYVWPFLAIWWWAASYEVRFLMAIIPVLAAMAALMIDDVATTLERVVIPRVGRGVAAVAVLVIVAMTLVGLRQTVEHKAVLMRGARLDDAAKHRLRIGGLYDLAVALNGLPRGSRVTGVPEMARLHVDSTRFSRLDWTARIGPPDQFSDGYDFVAYRPDGRSSFSWEATNPPILKTTDGYALFATHPSTGARTDRTSRLE